MELREDSLTEFPVDGGPRIRAANRSQGKAHGGPGPDQGQPLDGQGQSPGRSMMTFGTLRERKGSTRPGLPRQRGGGVVKWMTDRRG